MRKRDTISSLFWVLLSLLILKEGRALPFGSLASPKSGFFPLVIGIILGILSLVLLFRSLLGPKQEGDLGGLLPEREGWIRIGVASGIMFVFYLTLEWLGFLLATFFLIFVLIKFIQPQKWIYSLWVSILISLCSYVLFQVLLNTDLPGGITGK